MMKYKIEMTEQELNVLAQGLGELPLKVSLGVLQSMETQFLSQKNQEGGVSDKPLNADAAGS